MGYYAIIIIFVALLVIVCTGQLLYYQHKLIHIKQEALDAVREANEARERAITAEREAIKERDHAIAAEQQAKEERDRAKKADELRVIFMENMSHGIRTPLNAIVGFNEILMSDMADQISDEERREFLNMIHENARLLTSIIANILYLSKLDSGTFNPQMGEVVTRDLVETSLNTLEQSNCEKVQLSSDVPQEAVVILKTDVECVQTVLTHLLSNAAKNTTEGSIVLSCRVTGDNVEFAVTDTGTGVPFEHRAHIFERFYKADTFSPGSGLGLSICHEIARVLGGSIRLDESYTQGARFVFTLPITLA